MIGIFILIYGLLIGSFLNVCIYRIPKEESIAFPPSHCTSCEKRIKWYDLIPVISYVFLKGKCRYCGKKISIRYPLIELLTGVFFLALYINFGLTFQFFKFVIFICFLLVIGIIDLDTTDIYDNTIYLGIILGVILLIINYFLGYGFITYLWGAFTGGGIISLIILLTKGMGWGDAEFCLFCGLFLGFANTLLLLFISFIIGALAGIILILLKLKSRKDYLPFGPFIAIASIITVFWGNEIISFYLALN